MPVGFSRVAEKVIKLRPAASARLKGFRRRRTPACQLFSHSSRLPYWFSGFAASSSFSNCPRSCASISVALQRRDASARALAISSSSALCAST
ncbi:hypothetical protein X946_5556 [Burkholderia sp. ABCPW 111]|nr:hypothetical protein X946_5556 [Burkholderia sp. ABCPW 111]